MSETALPRNDIADAVVVDTSDAEAIAKETHETEVGGGTDERLAYRGVFQRLFIRPEIGAIVGAGAIWVFFWAVSSQFGTAGGASSILDVASTLGIMAVAVSLLMIGGEFDLSSGAATGALAIVTILLVKDVGDLGGAGLSLWIAIPISLILALGLGWFNGTMVERTGLPSFIVTLATFFILRGFKLGFSKLMIDNLTVGRIDEGHGYDFWHPIFAYAWARNDHQLGGRDLVYTIGCVGGAALIGASVAELNFRRGDRPNPLGLPVLGAGIVGVVAGILYMHNSDGVGANVAAAVIIGAGMLAAFVGLGLWRFAPQKPGPVTFSSETLAFLGGGVGLVGLGMVLARVLGVESQQPVLDLVGFFKWPLVILGGAAAAYRSWQKITGDRRGSQQSILSTIGIAASSAFAIYSFMFMSTEQGLRAMLFGVSVGAGFLALAMAAGRAGRASPISRTVVLTVAALSLAALAFFIRNESASVKFRSELFSVLLVAAGAVFVWGVIGAMFTARDGTTAGSNATGNLMTKLGLAAVAVGMLAKLLFTTDEEIAGGVNPAKYQIAILWFFGFTVLCTFLLGRTKFGSWIFAVGGNTQAARQIGVPAARTKTQLFMIVSVAAWLVGLLLAFRLNTVQSVAGNGLEFEYIIAAVVGGTLLTGGYGSAFGAAIGAVIMAMSKQGIPSARWNSDWRFAFLGIILLAAVIANNFIRTKAEAGTR